MKCEDDTCDQSHCRTCGCHMIGGWIGCGVQCEDCDVIESSCVWCGGEISVNKIPKSKRGERFCSKAHRDASARAVRNLQESAA
jgi:hypothetical protein